MACSLRPVRDGTHWLWFPAKIAFPRHPIGLTECATERPAHQRPTRFRLDRQQTVVFRQALGLRDGAGLELVAAPAHGQVDDPVVFGFAAAHADGDRKSTRLNSSHLGISYAVF